MYDTVSIKNRYKTIFCCGNQTDPEDTVLILGCCRVVPYLNYIDHYNQTLGGNKLRIYVIDPINYQVDEHGNALDLQGALLALESDQRFLEILKSVTIFIHEGISSFGILNTLGQEVAKSIYLFGMDPRIDINIPNFHDVFILFNDFIAIHPQYRDHALTNQEQEEIVSLGNGHIDRFCRICQMSSFPEFATFFLEKWLRTRLFHSFNHVSSAFTLEMFRLMNVKFLHWGLTDDYWREIAVHDMYANNSTPVTNLDLKWRKFQWL